MSSLILEDVYVHFPIFGSQPTLRKTLFSRTIGGLVAHEEQRRNRIVVKALNAISLDLKDGDRLGLIGHNGAGKSTLLRVMAGIYEPVSGSVRASGRITPLLEVLPGLDGEDTGYDNIVSSALMLGMSRQEIQSCIADIEEFTELGEYLALPVRTYSAGMLTRLGFALATTIEPDILLIDEGIGAGDQRFAERAERRLNTLIGRSRILVLSSHSDFLIHQFCNKVALLQEGRIIAIGSAADIIEQYHSSAASASDRPYGEPLGLRENSQEPEIGGHVGVEMSPLDTAIGDAVGHLSSLYYARASKIAGQGKYSEALSYYRKCLEVDPRSTLALLSIGQIETQMGSLDSALESFEKALAINPKLENAIAGITAVYFAKAASAAEEGSHSKALSNVEKCLEYDPGNIHALLTGGQVQTEMGSPEGAIEYYERILEIDPSNPAAVSGLENLENSMADEAVEK